MRGDVLQQMVRRATSEFLTSLVHLRSHFNIAVTRRPACYRPPETDCGNGYAPIDICKATHVSTLAASMLSLPFRNSASAHEVLQTHVP